MAGQRHDFLAAVDPNHNGTHIDTAQHTMAWQPVPNAVHSLAATAFHQRSGIALAGNEAGLEGDIRLARLSLARRLKAECQG
ncbi:hypothetical protein ACI2KG_13175 [Pseudomonas sp. NPDC089407]|uniref:hypothetical protein n=1 Tax=Pseudomonas sp. NPDC089407 TaxID=3364464 RepID=UPI00384D25C9